MPCLGVLPCRYLKAVEVSMEEALQEDAWSRSIVMVVRPLSEWGWGRVGAREEERGGEKRGDRGGIRRVLEGY